MRLSLGFDEIRHAFTPREMPGGCTEWWHAARSARTVASGLTSQVNGILHGINITAAGSARPTFTAAGLGGTPEFLFDGVANALTGTFTLVQPCTLCIVFASVAYGTAGVNDILLDGATAGSMVIGSLTNASTAISSGAGLSDAHALPDGTLTRLIAVYNGASSSLSYIDSTGVERTVTGNAGTNNAGGLTLGCLANTSRFYNFKLKELSLFPTAIAGGNLMRLKKYAQAQYGLAA